MAKRTSPPVRETAKKASDPGPMKTKTLPEAMHGGWFEGNDVVTALEIYGTGVTFELPRDRKTFTVGASADRTCCMNPVFRGRPSVPHRCRHGRPDASPQLCTA